MEKATEKDWVRVTRDNQVVENLHIEDLSGNQAAHRDAIQIIPHSKRNPRWQYMGGKISGVQIKNNEINSTGKLQGVFTSDGLVENITVTGNTIDVGSIHEITINGLLSGKITGNKRANGKPSILRLEPLRIGGGKFGNIFVMTFKDPKIKYGKIGKDVITDQEVYDWRFHEERPNAVYLYDFDLKGFQAEAEKIKDKGIDTFVRKVQNLALDYGTTNPASTPTPTPTTSEKPMPWWESLVLFLHWLLDMLKGLQEKKEVPEPDRPSKIFQSKIHNEKYKLLWDKYSYVKKGPSVKVKGNYATSDGFPIGLVVHYTAGWNKPGKAIDELANTKYGFFCIDITGDMYQPSNMPLNICANHAGRSAWNILGKKREGVSKYLLGVEITNGGLLDKTNKTWFGKYVKQEHRRVVKEKANRAAGTYEAYSKNQEETLIKFCLDMKKNNVNFDFDLILGHDEVSGPRGIGVRRKSDPGGSLSLNMDDFREKIKKIWNREL